MSRRVRVDPDGVRGTVGWRHVPAVAAGFLPGLGRTVGRGDVPAITALDDLDDGLV